LLVLLQLPNDNLTVHNYRILTAAFIKQTYLDSFYHSEFLLQEGFGVAWDLTAINETQLTKILSKPWTLDKQTFSDRLWTQKQALVNEVHTQLTQNMILGKASDEAIAAIAKKFNTSKHNAGRIVMTESAYFANLAQKNAFAKLGVKEYEIVTALDEKTCEICGPLDGKHFPLPQWEVGITAPIYHPFCRCCTAPYFDDLDGEVRP
jgi:SPP1 gp7 family putative phage head morphogenesis protein